LVKVIPIFFPLLGINLIGFGIARLRQFSSRDEEIVLKWDECLFFSYTLPDFTDAGKMTRY